MRRSAELFLSIIFVGALPALANACVLNGPRYQLESDTVHWTLELSGGENCIRGLRFGNVVVNSLTILSQPQTGRITLLGPGFSYKAKSDFQGPDFFSLIVSGSANKIPGSSTIEVIVSVSPPSSDPTSPLRSSPVLSPSPAPSPPLNNLCGSSNGVALRSAPTANLCSVATASTVTGTGPWYWSCAESNGKANSQCSALVPGELSQIDGGPNYFSKFNGNSGWLNDRILLGGWSEQPQTSAEVGYDVAMGNNIYWNLSGGSVSYNIIRAVGMHVVAPFSQSDTGSETVGWLGTDEPDLRLGPGSGPFDIKTDHCITSTRCGYTAARFFYTGEPSSIGTLTYPIDGRVVLTGYGKGVLQFESPSEAVPFLQWSDILGADEYWFTDTNAYGSFWGACQAAPNSIACTNGKGFTPAQAQLAANYEANVTKLRSLQMLNGASKPIVADIETGCPFNNDKCVTSAQFTAAAWHALIAGARGIVWFQHNFSGPCQDFRTFQDGSNPSSRFYHCQIVPGETMHDLVQAVTAFNVEVASLNSVLLSPIANGYATATGTVSVMTKYHNNQFYVFAGSGQPGVPPPTNQSVTFTLAGFPNATATVVNENRTIKVVNGQFTDTFVDANAVHIYQISAEN